MNKIEPFQSEESTIISNGNLFKRFNSNPQLYFSFPLLLQESETPFHHTPHTLKNFHLLSTMVENQENLKRKEKEIPVFTVLKNNCILKNIFVLDSPPPIPSSSPVLGAGHSDQESEREETLLVGRHPDCNIKLEHPSISRFHLRIHSKPSSRSLFVTDLSSGKPPLCVRACVCEIHVSW